MPLVFEPVVALAVLLVPEEPQTSSGPLQRQVVWRSAYLKTARLKDQSTSGFLSSNFARLFIRCRPPNIKAAYRAENRNDFFLQNKTKKKPVKCLISIRDTAESHTDVTAKGLCASLNGNSFGDIPASQLSLSFLYETTRLYTVRARCRQNWPWGSSGKRQTNLAPILRQFPNWTSVRNTIDTAEPRHTFSSKRRLVLEPVDHILCLIYLFHTNFCFLQDPPYVAI